MVNNYITTLYWNYLYYTKGDNFINQEWVYPDFYSPMLVDLTIYSSNLMITPIYKSFPGMLNYNSLHQLLSVLPKTSKQILPIELQDLMDISSPIYDLYPSKFITDKEGKIYKQSTLKPKIDFSIAIIPLVDLRRIVNIVNLIPFSMERKNLWESQQDLYLIKQKPEVRQKYIPIVKQQIPQTYKKLPSFLNYNILKNYLLTNQI